MESTELHELGTEIFAAFSELSGIQDIASRSVGKRLISEEQRFRLWAHSLGLHNQGHSSLDYRVRDAVAVKSRLADILAELKGHLENLLAVHRGERQPFEIAAAAAAAAPSDGAYDGDSDARSTSPSLSSGDTSFYEVDFRMESVAETLDALYSLATKIKNPRNRPQLAIDELYKHIPAHVRKEFIQEREEAAIAIICHVQRQQLSEGLQHGGLKASGMSHDEVLEQYASPSNWLVRRTGIANARRRQQFVYWKEHAERIVRGPASNAPPPLYNDAPAADNKQPFQPEQGEHVPIQPVLGRSLATSATRLGETFVKLDDLKSVISHQSRVSTVMNLRGDKLEWPSPPVQTASSGFFTCPYCRIICPRKYLAKEAWCVHLIHDLQPYHCTFERCHDPNRICGTRQEWLEHESLHTRVWHCAAHGEEFETQPEYTAHLHEKHAEQEAEYFSPELIAAAVGPSLRLHRDCPFCPTAFSGASALQKHVMFHLERLALLALPADDEDGIDKSERASDSHEGQRRGRVGSIQGDFTDEEQLLFTDIFGSTASDQHGPKTAMAAIQEAASRPEEIPFLSQWLADSEGADADPSQLTGEPRPSDSKAQEGLSPHERSVPNNEGPGEVSGQLEPTHPNPKFHGQPNAPVEEHFPYLPWRGTTENFNYRPGLSVDRQSSAEEEGGEGGEVDHEVDQSAISDSHPSPSQSSIRDLASRLMSKIWIFGGQTAQNEAT
ncbi:hypothetical protein Daus18300_011516 [Diaporthe australafricana]|uniref:C2H2-type domain-containing protein n=1 Tax=Diaporthe australafricana TaxID=127596 RepID=A0ABR3W659_9PEZI